MKVEGPYETRIPHQLNFIESVRMRKDPVVPVEIGTAAVPFVILETLHAH